MYATAFQQAPVADQRRSLAGLCSHNGQHVGAGIGHAGRSGSRRVRSGQKRACGQKARTPSPSLRIKRAVVCTWRSSRRHPLLRRLQRVLYHVSGMHTTTYPRGILLERRRENPESLEFASFGSSVAGVCSFHTRIAPTCSSWATNLFSHVGRQHGERCQRRTAPGVGRAVRP